MTLLASTVIVPRVMKSALILEGKDTDIVHNLDIFSQPAGTRFEKPIEVM
jgi:hypothetical protein